MHHTCHLCTIHKRLHALHVHICVRKKTTTWVLTQTPMWWITPNLHFLFEEGQHGPSLLGKWAGEDSRRGLERHSETVRRSVEAARSDRWLGLAGSWQLEATFSKIKEFVFLKKTKMWGIKMREPKIWEQKYGKNTGKNMGNKIREPKIMGRKHYGNHILFGKFWLRRLWCWDNGTPSLSHVFQTTWQPETLCLYEPERTCHLQRGFVNGMCIEAVFWPLTSVAVDGADDFAWLKELLEKHNGKSSSSPYLLFGLY